MNAVVYARFSSHRQGEQSIEGQVAEAERFAAVHGLTIVKVYADRAQTGRNDNREQFQLMLADAAKHAFDALIVWKTDRIGRNKEEIALNKYHLKKNGVKIYYVAEAIPDTPEGIILEAVIEGMAAYYSEQLSQNVRRGMKNSAQKGRYTGGTCPMGYTITADKKYEVDPKYAPVVREIFQLYSEGKTITEIVKILNDKGLRTSRGHAFTHNSLRTVLKNKKYIGTYEYNGEVSIENAVPPIVDVDVFNKVQDLLAFNHKAGAHKKAKVDYILFGKIFCGKCGAGMTGICGTSKQKVKHHYYICSAKKKKLCTKRAVRQDWIETLVLKHLLRLVRNEELLEFIAENTYQYFLAQNTDTTYTKSLQKALDETDRAINNLLRAIEAGIFNESTKDRMNELEEQKKDLRVALVAAKLKEDLALKKEHIVFFLHQFAGMDYSDIDCQKRLIKTFLNSVFVYDDKVVLTFNYSGDDRTITLHEIDGGLGHSICIPSAVVHQNNTSAYTGVLFFVFRPWEIPFVSFHPHKIKSRAGSPYPAHFLHIFHHADDGCAKDNRNDNGQNNHNTYHDHLRLCPVPEGIFLLGVTAPDKEHDQIHDTAHQRNAGNQRAANPAANGNGFLLSGAGCCRRNIRTTVGAEGNVVIERKTTIGTSFHRIYLFSFSWDYILSRAQMSVKRQHLFSFPQSAH